MNPNALAAALAEIDTDLLELLLKLRKLETDFAPWSPAIPVILHAQETVALLSSGIEELAMRLAQDGPENPSFN